MTLETHKYISRGHQAYLLNIREKEVGERRKGKMMEEEERMA